MKKITLTLMFVGALSFAQSNQQFLVGNAEAYNGFKGAEDACSHEFDPYDQLILANAVTDHGPYAVANDIMVDANSSFEIQELTFLLLPLAGSAADISAATIRVYEDGGSMPGAGIADGTLIGAGNDVHPDTFAGYTMWYMHFEMDAPVVITNTDSEAKRYWIGLTVTSASGQHAYLVGYFWDETMGSYHYNFQSQGGLGGVYDPIIFEDYPGEFFDSEWAIYGDCSPLSVNDHLLSQVSVSPNPAVDFVSINVPNGVEINNAVVYDILGKDTGVTLINGQLNVSQLQKGIYLLSINTNQGTLTQKIVKR